MPLTLCRPAQHGPALLDAPIGMQHRPDSHVLPPAQLLSHGQHGPPGCAHVQTPVKHQRPGLQPLPPQHV